MAAEATMNALGVRAILGLLIVVSTRAYHDASSPEGLIVVLIIDSKTIHLCHGAS